MNWLTQRDTHKEWLMERLEGLRQAVAGWHFRFPQPKESVHDAFGGGLRTTPRSPWLLAWPGPRKLWGAGPCGCRHWRWLVHGRHGLRGDEQHRPDNLLVVLNDNKMSISKMSAPARYFSHLRTTSRYIDAKENVRTFLERRIPRSVRRSIRHSGRKETACGP